MTNLEMLQRYEETERLAATIDPYFGGPWAGPACTFAEFQALMLRQIAVACSLTVDEVGRLSGAKTCLSCGAYQSIDGTLPCDH